MNTVSAIMDNGAPPLSTVTATPHSLNSPDVTNTLTGDIPPPRLVKSINELRRFSAALSAFISRYDDLQNHISFVKSEIESKLPNYLVEVAVNPKQSPVTRLLETDCDRTITVFPEVVVAERNPRESESEIEVVDVLKSCEGIDVFEKDVESDSSNKCEEIDTLNKTDETITECYCDQTITVVAEASVSGQNTNGTAANSERVHETAKTPKNLEEIDVIMQPEEIDTLNTEETVVESSCDQTITVVPEAVVSEQIPDGMAGNCVKSGENVRQSESVDESNTFKETDETILETSFDQTIIVVSEQNLNGMVGNCKQSHENVRAPEIPEQTDFGKNAEEIGTLKKQNETSKKSVISVLESLCRRMHSTRMRNHVAKHLFTMNNHREEITKALKLAEDPARLVLDSTGRFFVEGSKPSCKGYGFNEKRAKARRLASVLILEYFVIISSDGIEIAKQDQDYAAAQAVIWKNRMIGEGGLRHTEEVDARGLLLLISGFGIQDNDFTIQDITDLIIASNVKEVATALRCSVFLIPKISEVIHFMVKNDLEIEAVDLAYTFGLEDKCHPQNILTTYLHKQLIDIQNGSSVQTLEAMKQQLVDLESVKQCLEAHNIDPLMLLPEFQINEKIQNLEKKLNKGKLVQKRKSSKNPIHPESKRACFGHKNIPHQQKRAVKKPNHVDASSYSEEIGVFEKPVEIDTSKKHAETGIKKKATETETSKESMISILESLCQSMRCKKMKTHVAKHISEMTNLRHEIAKALMLAKDPAKLVLNSIGEFFVQGSKPSCKGYCFRHEDQKAGRLASVLILECFVMISSDGIEIAKQDQERAAAEAVIWKERMIREGGLSQTEEADARGLLLLVCGFRIQDHGFMIHDIVDLIRSSNVKGISAALCRSAFLIPKIPEVIYFMVKNDLEVEAVDLVYTFGLEDMCDPRNILTTYLPKKLKDIQNGSSIQMLESMKQQLLDLESVKQCLESYNVDPLKLLPEFQINEKIQNLEKEINSGTLIQKRKSLENPIHHESKRACFGHENLPHQQEHALTKPDVVDASSNSEELDVFKKPVEIGDSKKCEETVPETSCDQTTTAVPEAIISEQNPNGMVADCEQMEENVRTPEILEERDVSMKPEGIETLKETDETIPEKSCDQAITAVPEAIVSEQNPKGMATNCEQIHESLRAPENLDEIDVSKTPEEIDVLKKPEEIAILKKTEETIPETCDQTISAVLEAIVAEQSPNGMATDCEQIPENVRTPESVEETDITMKPEEIDSMKTEETVPEASCNQTMTALPKAIVSEQFPNGTVADCEQIHENVRTPEIHEEIHVSKKPEQTDYCKSPEKIDALHPEEIARPPEVLEVDVSKKPEVTSTSKKPRVISKSKKPGAISKSKKPGAISASKKPEAISTSKKLQQADILNKPEKTDFCKNFDEIDSLKEYEETGIEKKDTKTGTSKKPEVISTSKKLEQTDFCKNTEEIDTSKKHAETGIEKKATNTETSKKPEVISTSKKPKVISTSKKLKQTDILNKPEQTDLCKNLEEIDTSKKHAETGFEKKATKTETSKKPEVISTSKKSKVISTSKKLKQTDILNKPEQIDFCKNTEKDTTKKHAETGIEKKDTKTETSKKSVISELEVLCRRMSSKEMTRHVATHFSEMINLRHEIAEALKLAKDPAKLVLDSIGRFYVQSRSYCKGYGSQQEHQNGMLASVLILECFVMISSDGIEIEKRDCEYAAAEAVLWRKRMIREGGGLRHTDKVDARGLLLLISGFGIQDRVFTIKDITDLIRASKVKEIATALRRSVSLVSKIPEVVDWMMKNNLEIEAVDIAYTFGLEDTCRSRKMLSKFLDKKVKDIRNGSHLKLEAAKRHLSDLKSVRQCLESHNIDPSTLLREFKINERIQNLEKEINEEKLVRKRESSESRIHNKPKRARLGLKNMPHQQKHADHYDMRQLTPPSSRHLYLDRNHSNSYVTNYLHPSVLNAPAMPENIPVLVPHGLAGGVRGSYNQMVHLDNVQPYGHYTRHVHTYVPQTYCRSTELGPLESFLAFPDPSPGLLGRHGTSLGLYRFADMVEKKVGYS